MKQKQKIKTQNNVANTINRKMLVKKQKSRIIAACYFQSNQNFTFLILYSKFCSKIQFWLRKYLHIRLS